ncbi:hypothetical protein ABZZ79_33865 [Streptomyces sp. NPDC006458]|uniref:hypothetical protein n=1 Tax=Streptomyces sp. NPDC006458 TaxID=3154302 RepID=UPI0033BB0F8F
MTIARAAIISNRRLTGLSADAIAELISDASPLCMNGDGNGDGFQSRRSDPSGPAS